MVVFCLGEVDTISSSFWSDFALFLSASFLPLIAKVFVHQVMIVNLEISLRLSLVIYFATPSSRSNYTSMVYHELQPQRATNVLAISPQTRRSPASLERLIEERMRSGERRAGGGQRESAGTEYNWTAMEDPINWPVNRPVQGETGRIDTA